MQFIDSHSHIYLDEFKNDLDEVISRTISSGVNKILLPNIDSSSVESMLNVARKYPGICYPMIGIHPTSVKKDFLEQYETVLHWLEKERFIAIGEVGIDLYWDSTFIEEQTKILKMQIELALEKELPLVIHSRESFLQIFKILKDYEGSNLRGVFHAFTGDTGEAEHIINSGFYLGIGGIVTFKNSGLDRVIEDIGIDKLLLETDSPYLAPTPYRGKRNESSYIPIIAERIATICSTSIAEVAKVTSENANKLFNLK